MKIAITAANRQLGTEIVNATVALPSKGNVIGLARTPDKATNLGIEIRPGDYNDKNVLEKSLQSVDTLALESIRAFEREKLITTAIILRQQAENMKAGRPISKTLNQIHNNSLNRTQIAPVMLRVSVS